MRIETVFVASPCKTEGLKLVSDIPVRARLMRWWFWTKLTTSFISRLILGVFLILVGALLILSLLEFSGATMLPALMITVFIKAAVAITTRYY